MNTTMIKRKIKEKIYPLVIFISILVIIKSVVLLIFAVEIEKNDTEVEIALTKQYQVSLTMIFCGICQLILSRFCEKKSKGVVKIANAFSWFWILPISFILLINAFVTNLETSKVIIQSIISYKEAITILVNAVIGILIAIQAYTATSIINKEEEKKEMEMKIRLEMDQLYHIADSIGTEIKDISAVGLLVYQNGAENKRKIKITYDGDKGGFFPWVSKVEIIPIVKINSHMLKNIIIDRNIFVDNKAIILECDEPELKKLFMNPEINKGGKIEIDLNITATVCFESTQYDIGKAIENVLKYTINMELFCGSGYHNWTGGNLIKYFSFVVEKYNVIKNN